MSNVTGREWERNGIDIATVRFLVNDPNSAGTIYLTPRVIESLSGLCDAYEALAVAARDYLRLSSVLAFAEMYPGQAEEHRTETEAAWQSLRALLGEASS